MQYFPKLHIQSVEAARLVFPKNLALVYRQGRCPTLISSLVGHFYMDNVVYASVAMHSISMRALRGSAATWYVDRAGAVPGKSATTTKGVENYEWDDVQFRERPNDKWIVTYSISRLDRYLISCPLCG